jgi:N-acetyl-gamma-glutamylphosphate reductase
MNSKPETRNSKLRIAIFGGSGYGGSELLRILLLHPNVEIVFVTANEHAGKSVGDVHRNLLGLTEMKFIKAPEDVENLGDLDCAFFALPHGQAMEIAPRLPANVKVIDLSGDFRLTDPESFAKHYGREHTRMDAQAQFVYGLTETNREAIKSARCIANPGCFATATFARSRAAGRQQLAELSSNRRRENRFVRIRRQSLRRIRIIPSAAIPSMPISLSLTSTCRRSSRHCRASVNGTMNSSS